MGDGQLTADLLLELDQWAGRKHKAYHGRLLERLVDLREPCQGLGLT
ncbi:hypothetical protein [uncultured Arsenicicoccus sp.]|nr:hypothetical protein [uncultured Arsenicicoccus sp.]